MKGVALIAVEGAKVSPFRALVDPSGFVKDVKDLEPFADKWRAFGWDVKVIDGHNLYEVLDAYAYADSRVGSGKPVCILARSEKGRGVSFMTLKADYHGRALTDDEMTRALPELGESYSGAL